MAIQQFPLGSTAIDTVWYDAETLDLWIKFRKTKVYPKYHFEGVPGPVFAGLLNARSNGDYYHKNIKGKFYSTEITSPKDDGTLNIFQLGLGHTG